MMKKKLFAKLEMALNRIIQCDPEFLPRLLRHQGKTLELCLNGLNLTVFITVCSDGLTLREDKPEVVTSTVYTTPFNLLSLLCRPQQKMHMTMTDALTIMGDTAFCQDIFALLQEFEIDWEEYLARLTNDSIAVTLMHALRQVKHMTQRAQSDLAQNVQEYLQYEAHVLVPPVPVQNFLSAVDVLVHDSARLAARISQLEQMYDQAD